jgi:hypothetical protein
VDLQGADLQGTLLEQADLPEADLSFAILVQTNFQDANLTDCTVYGVAAWDVKRSGATQRNLHIPMLDEHSHTFSQPAITVDQLEVAQFIHLLLHNSKIRNVIDTVGKKAVLVSGRFESERVGKE